MKLVDPWMKLRLRCSQYLEDHSSDGVNNTASWGFPNESHLEMGNPTG